MKAFQIDFRRYGLSLPLVAVIVACGLWIGYEADWGKRGPHPVLQPAGKRVPLKEIRLAPDFALPGPDRDLAATTARPLFNSSRRPQASATQAGSAHSGGLPSGRFTLTGVSISDESRVALLRDAATNKTIRAEQSKEVNGVLVESVTPDKVTLKLGSEREEIALKIAPAPPAPAASAPKADQAAGKAAAAGALPPIQPRQAPLPSTAAEAPGATKAAADIANADPITPADVAERAARVQARRNRQSAAGERVSK